MDDWDPFADPSDTQTPAQPERAEPVERVETSAKRKPADDIFAAFRSLDLAAKPAVAADEADVHRSLDELFSVDDADVESLRKAVAGLPKGGNCHLKKWLRSMPMLEAPSCSNLLGLLIDECLGLSSDQSSNPMSAIHVDLPVGNQSAEVVFLLAWGGGSLADMQDVIELYRELFPECTIFVSTSNQKQSFGLRCQCAAGISAAASAWAQTSSAPKLLVHLFSNSGMHTWTELLQAWSTLRACPNLEEKGVALAAPLPPMEQVLQGIILDSACDSQVPIDSCIQSFVQTIAATVSVAASLDHDGSEEGKKAAEVAGKRAIAGTIGANSVAKEYLYNKPEKMLTKLASADVAAVHALEPPVPMQFIYSKDDNIILQRGVERYLEEVKQRPSRKAMAMPRVWCIEKSRHCFHKIIHRDEYRKCVRVFASSVMT
ncbi:unnamed protein product [Effrenium voratum]|nr:unnamed protein product [Effrenium voratum]